MVVGPLALSLVLGIGSVSTAELAPEAPGEPDKTQPPQEAVDAFFEGKDLYASAQYEEALEAFTRADRLHPAPDLQYNIGLCHMRLEHWQEAINAFEIYLRTKEDPPDRADVEARIAEAQRRLDQGKAAPTAVPSNEPGPSAPGPAVPQPPTDDPDPPSGADGKPYRGLVVSGSVLFALGAAGAIGTTTGLGLMIVDRNNTLDEVTSEGNPSGIVYADAVDIQEEAERLRTAQIIGGAAFGAVAVVGGALLTVGLVRRSKARKTPSAAVSILPSAGPRGAGLGLRYAF